MKSVTIERNGYEPFIDYLKGICIIWVLINHTLPDYIRNIIAFPFWGEWAVPIFLLIQVFHAYKKESCYSIKTNYIRVIKRIFLPFLCCTLLIFIIRYACGDTFSELLGRLKYGGIGPGEYYPFIYLQFYFILPFLHFAFLNRFWVVCVVLFCIFLDPFSFMMDMDPLVYKLLCVRYLFLIPLGYIWTKYGIVVNATSVILSLVSIIFIYLFVYTNFDMEPYFYPNGWRIFHWICYFYPTFLLPFCLFAFYKKNPLSVNKYILICGRYSYDIFIFQMFMFGTLPFIINNIVIANLASLLMSCAFPVVKFLLTNKG